MSATNLSNLDRVTLEALNETNATSAAQIYSQFVKNKLADDNKKSKCATLSAIPLLD